MADRARRIPENAEGPFFVDSSCIDCDTCRQLAPATFADNGRFSYVCTQPEGAEEERAAFRALVACPAGSIGAGDPGGVKRATAEFPLLLADDVFYCGFNSPKSFGGNSYFVEHAGGNWLIDSPRYAEPLARQFERRGGIRYVFLTHRDDVADAGRWAARFGAERIIHRLERSAQPDAERLLDGFEPVELAPGFLAIPTPGHTRGHCVLLHGQFLFTGDHLSWNRGQRKLTAHRDYCWHSWREQVASLSRLKAYEFAWVLPGHGQRIRMRPDEMRRQLEWLIRSAATAA
ncbi:MAG TPA: MBL fold metallo-hydrolase [Bryobacteraceae bacterium]|nr:MBL fold metallo-hydrolase [Bryobacteraceae bacterium]